MIEGDRSGMERDHGAQRPAGSVTQVPRDDAAHRRQLDPDLVRPPGFESHLEQRSGCGRSEDAVLESGVAGAHFIRGRDPDVNALLKKRGFPTN